MDWLTLLMITLMLTLWQMKEFILSSFMLLGIYVALHNNTHIYSSSNVTHASNRCGHCQRLAPTWDELATHFESHPNIHISKLDCTLYSLTCQQNEIKGYPTLLLFEEGQVREKYTGNRDLQSLIEFVSSVVPTHEKVMTFVHCSLAWQCVS